MKNNWNIKESKKYINSYKKKKINSDLALRIYTTHLLGNNSNLVLHGGGNTSVKTQSKNIQGKKIDIIYIKGSGWDMSNLNENGMPGLELKPLRDLLSIKKLSDSDMVNYLRKNLLNNKSPNPSVETLLHAFLPHKFIDHTHSTAILSIVNQKNSLKICKKVFGKKIGIVKYIMPGFNLAINCHKIYNQNKNIEALILLNHGIFTFGNSAKESYSRMIKYVNRAENYININKKNKIDKLIKKNNKKIDIINLSLKVRNTIFNLTNEKWVVNFYSSKKLIQLTKSKLFLHSIIKGPVTPDHVIRIKPNPMIYNNNISSIETQIKKYSQKYSQYFKKFNKLIKGSIQTDPLPRVIILPNIGIFLLGKNFKETQIIKDIFISACESIDGTNKIGVYKSIPKDEIFKMEYWPLERAKITKNKMPDLNGKIVVITGGCGTIGLAIADEFINDGAEVILLDNNKKNISSIPDKIKSKIMHIYCDVTNKLTIQKVFKRIINTFGGIDIVISNAGKAFQGDIANVSINKIKKSFDINFFSHQIVAQESVKIFKKQNIGGIVLFNISKQSINPGKEFGPYGLPKSSTLFLMKQYVLEYSKYNIRFNGINADRIQSGILNKKLINKRAKSRGLSKKEYLRSNLLKVQVNAKDVAKAFIFQAKLSKTTGNIITVDGGNIEASLR